MRVYTTGVFDLLHRGHLNILTQAAALGELTVGIMTDQAVEDTKGIRPILTLEERDQQIRSLPFVAAVVHYSDIDQRALYDRLKPDVVVQGDDWLTSADRTEALAYFREHDVRLVLLPRTDGISTTELRRRVERSARRDETFLLERVRLVSLSDLKRFEQFDEAKVARLCDRIARTEIYLNPISIVREKVVIDGVNRLEAVRRLGGRQIPCVVYDYADVELLGNVHFIHEGRTTRLSEFARSQGTRVEFPRRTPADIFHAVETGKLIPSGETFHRVPQTVIRLPVPLAALREPSGLDLTALIRERIERGQIRFCHAATYVCDEW